MCHLLGTLTIILNCLPLTVGNIRLNNFEKREILEHEDNHEILRDTKTIFIPESKFSRRRWRHSGILGQKGGYKNKNDVKENKQFGSISESDCEANEQPSIDAINNTKVINTDKLIIIVNCDSRNKDNGTFRDDNKHIFWHNQKTREEIRNIQSELMRNYMNPHADPCSDFYDYACGNWKRYYTIPHDRSIYDTFEIIREKLDLALNEILQNRSDLSQKVANLSPNVYDSLFTEVRFNDTTDSAVKARWLYWSCMREDIIFKRGSKPLLEIIDALGGWPILTDNIKRKFHFDLVTLLARLRLLNSEALISQWIGPDMKNSNRYIVHIDQTILNLPDREYYLDSKNIKYVQAYRIFILSTVKLLGADPATAERDVDDIIEFETQLARIMMPSEERKNLSDVYLRTDIASLTLYFPQFDWKTYFDSVLGTDIDLETPVAVYCAKYILNLFYVLSNNSPRVVNNYLIWKFVKPILNNLDRRFLTIKQRFNYIVFGKEKPPNRWQFCVSQVNTHMGMALGSLFVKKYFDTVSKVDTIEMAEELQQAFKSILAENSWLDNHTKEYAKMKIDSMDLKIGFPDFILNQTELTSRYYDIVVHPRYFFENVLSVLRHTARVERKRLGSPMNRTLWSTPPAVVNAYYSRNKNQIMFPAGILQPPFYHKHFPKALNFGGIGVVIGHEITHGFDDKGRLFDHQGNLMMWWRHSSIKTFYEKAQCLINQYSQYVLPDVKLSLDGYLTQGENIADNGGLKQSFRAYETWLSKHPDADESLPGLNLTQRQLFFLNFAQVWCGQQRLEEAKNRMKTSVHSPGIFRIIGVLSNSEDFANAYNCAINSPMNPEKKCTIW